MQNTLEWQMARCGKVTASRIKDIKAKPQKGKALNATLMAILAERISGIPDSTPPTVAMQWGIDHEAEARTVYERFKLTDVVQCGFIDHPTIAMSGASPDGLVGDDGLIEIKCPSTAVHLNTILTKQVPAEYIPQITWQLACTERIWCDFVSYDPRLEPTLQIYVVRVHRDDVDIAGLEQAVIDANDAMDKAMDKLTL